MATETYLDEVFLKFFQAAALLKSDGWLVGFFFLFFLSCLLFLAFMSESMYKAALLILTSKFRFQVKKCALQCRITSGTCDNTLDCTFPRLQRASRVQFSHTGLGSFTVLLGPL